MVIEHIGGHKTDGAAEHAVLLGNCLVCLVFIFLGVAAFGDESAVSAAVNSGLALGAAAGMNAKDEDGDGDDDGCEGGGVDNEADVGPLGGRLASELAARLRHLVATHVDAAVEAGDELWERAHHAIAEEQYRRTAARRAAEERATAQPPPTSIPKPRIVLPPIERVHAATSAATDEDGAVGE